MRSKPNEEQLEMKPKLGTPETLINQVLVWQPYLVGKYLSICSPDTVLEPLCLKLPPLLIICAVKVSTTTILYKNDAKVHWSESKQEKETFYIFITEWI